MIANDSMVLDILDNCGGSVKTVKEVLGIVVNDFDVMHGKLLRSANKLGILKLDGETVVVTPVLESVRAASNSLMHVQDTVDKVLYEGINPVYSQDELMYGARKLKTVVTRLTSVLEFLGKAEEIANGYVDNNSVYTCDNEKLQHEPLKTGDLILPNLKSIPHKIFVSATLAIEQNFSLIKEELGVSPQEQATIMERIYPSAFDYARQVILYIPHTLSLPQKPTDAGRGTWIRDIGDEIVKLVTLTGGNAFVLFSARADMNEVTEHVRLAMDSAGLPLIVQDGDAAPAQQAYMDTPNSVLFGLKSFWEGVDIVGDKLKMVIIPKLPFPNPQDPVVATLSEQIGKGSFYALSFPKMVADMRQGVGRLIRSKTDRGVIAILDKRVWSGQGNQEKHDAAMVKVLADPKMRKVGYGGKLIEDLGFTTWTSNLTGVENYVRQMFRK